MCQRRLCFVYALQLSYNTFYESAHNDHSTVAIVLLNGRSLKCNVYFYLTRTVVHGTVQILHVYYELRDQQTINCSIIYHTLYMYFSYICTCIFCVGILQLLHVEVILLVYRRLIEDVTGFDNQLSGQRKSDLMTEMKSETFLSPLINYVITVLKVMFSSTSLLSV